MGFEELLSSLFQIVIPVFFLVYHRLEVHVLKEVINLDGLLLLTHVTLASFVLSTMFCCCNPVLCQQRKAEEETYDLYLVLRYNLICAMRFHTIHRKLTTNPVC